MSSPADILSLPSYLEQQRCRVDARLEQRARVRHDMPFGRTYFLLLLARDDRDVVQEPVCFWRNGNSPRGIDVIAFTSYECRVSAEDAARC